MQTTSGGHLFKNSAPFLKSGMFWAHTERAPCVKSFPIGIDVSDFQEVAARARPNRIVSQTIVGLGSRKLIIGVDRLDYSKGIRERMEAYERFLVSNPDERGHVTYLQIAPAVAHQAAGYGIVTSFVDRRYPVVRGQSH